MLNAISRTNSHHIEIWQKFKCLRCCVHLLRQMRDDTQDVLTRVLTHSESWLTYSLIRDGATHKIFTSLRNRILCAEIRLKCNLYQLRGAMMMSVYLCICIWIVYCVHSPLEAKIIPVFALQTLPGNLYPHQVNMNTKFSHHIAMHCLENGQGSLFAIVDVFQL